MMFIFISLLAYALAEPPVGAGYTASRSNHGHHGLDNLRSLAQDYDAPAIGTRSSYSTEARSFSHDQSISAPSQGYGPPEARTGVSQEFRLPSKARSSFSQQYKPPTARSGLSQEYGTPNSRSGLSQEYGTPSARSGLSQEYGPPNARTGISQEYGLPNARTGISQEYGLPNARTGISQEYGLPNARTGISQEYGLPSARLSQQYGSPNRNTGTDYTQDYSITSARLSKEYGTPQLRTGSEDYKTDIPSDTYGTPLQRSLQLSDYKPSEEFDVPPQSFNQSPSQKYGQPKFRNFHSSSNALSKSSYSDRFNKAPASSRTFQSALGSRTPQNKGTPRSSYSIPSARNIDSYSPASKSVSASYLPSSRSVSQTYALPEEQGFSSDYAAPDARGLNTYASSFDTARPSPSTQYGTPSVRDTIPSEQYGLPQQYDALSSQGYSYARNALDELLNQEPANYDFGYKVNDYISGSDFGHTESRQDNRAEGSYFVVLPDGTKQVVEYEADERGFKPRISVEPADSRSGYDENSADLTRTADGPY